MCGLPADCEAAHALAAAGPELVVAVGDEERHAPALQVVEGQRHAPAGEVADATAHDARAIEPRQAEREVELASEPALDRARVAVADLERLGLIQRDEHVIADELREKIVRAPRPRDAERDDSDQ